jgi:hypothetical protein
VSAVRAYEGGRRPLGEILRARGLITAPQLQEALEAQRREGGRIGEILFAQGWVSTVDLRDALAEQRGFDLSVKPPGRPTLSEQDGLGAFPLGRLLVRRGHISETQLDAALAEQQRSHRRLGQILISNGAVSAFVLAAALAEQQGLVSASRQLWAATRKSPESSDTWYEVRELDEGKRYRLYASRSFLDATDLAFAVLHEWHPEELHVMRVEGDRDAELCWKYPPT